MLRNISAGDLPTDNLHPPQSKRRKQITGNEPYETLQPSLPKKRRISTDTVTRLQVDEEQYESVGGPIAQKARIGNALKAVSQTRLAALSVPQEEDCVVDVISKLTAIVDTVRGARSIAGLTTDSITRDHVRNPEMIAQSQMRPDEYDSWTTFNDGLWHLPELDWEANQLPPSKSPKSLKLARRRAEALNRLYKTDRAHEGHVMWITQNMIEFLPMVKATARVIGAEKNLVGGGEWHANQLEDLQSVNRILSISTQICQGKKSKLIQLKMAETQQVLGDYRKTLQASRVRNSTSIRASEERISDKIGQELDNSRSHIPQQFKVAKVLPQRNSLCLYRLVEQATFRCNRCDGRKMSKLVAFAQNQYDQPICNGCYGRVCSTGAPEKQDIGGMYLPRVVPREPPSVPTAIDNDGDSLEIGQAGFQARQDEI
ncbi:hypothetical protein PVAG01_07140 [Phlyctema vagabunda]|uniref:Uncharacterized protein n=1 Tax=Phlyctema vagabunda TaxID=108571 RepID=A0ABR4PBM9_9HELO